MALDQIRWLSFDFEAE